MRVGQREYFISYYGRKPLESTITVYIHTCRPSSTQVRQRMQRTYLTAYDISLNQILVVAFLTAVLLSPRLLKADSDLSNVIDVGVKKQIFLDGFFLDSQDHLRLTMHKPYRNGMILIKPDRSWEMDSKGNEHRISLYSCVLKQDGRVRVWYGMGRGKGSPEIRVLYAESEDGIHFKKPELGLHEVDGSNANNVVLPGPRIAGAAVWVDPKAPPEHRYKTQTKVYPPGQREKLEMHSSPDGIHWNIFAEPKVGHIDTQNIIFWEPSVGRYLFFTRFWEKNLDLNKRYRTIRRLESDDLVTWENEKPIMLPDDRDWSVHPRSGVSGKPPVDFYGGAVCKYEEAYQAYLMFTQSYWHWMDWSEAGLGPATIDVQLAVSRNAEHFERVGRRRPFISLGPEGRFDSRFIWAMPNPIRMGDELWIYYVASNRDHSRSSKIDPLAGKELSGIGRAVLRLDGFVSVDADYRPGQFKTPFLRFQGNRLELNVDAAGGGSVRVELLDEDGEPIKGFGKDDAIPIARNSVRMPVVWKGNPDLSALVGRTVRMRFHMTNASLYAFQFKEIKTAEN